VPLGWLCGAKNDITMKKCLVLLLFPLSLCAQNHVSARMQQFIRGQHDYFGFNGNVVVAKEGRVLYQDALGFASMEPKRMLTNNSVFELASLSDQFTAMSIMICKEKGLLRYDDNLKLFFPQLPYDNITIRNLITHTSGLPNYEDQFKMYWDHGKIAANSDVVDMLKKRNDSLLFKPGTKYRNSNTGYVLLASIVEKVTGMSFSEFLARNIFKPLGMTESYCFPAKGPGGKVSLNTASGYVFSDSLKRFVPVDSVAGYGYSNDLGGIVGDRGVKSNAGDLLTWTKALYGNQLVSEATLNEMLSPIVPRSPGDTSNYVGFAYNVQPKSPDGKLISLSGSLPGYRTQMTVFMNKKETIILLSNNEFSIAFLQAALESILDGEMLVMPYKHTEIKIDTALLGDYVGKYTAGLTLEFIKKDGKLFRHRTGTADIELKPESPTKFFYADGTDRQIEFERDISGKVSKVWFLNTGQKGEMKKVQ
jgi:CubicO group peptidase (beta-lactamase class C family)